MRSGAKGETGVSLLTVRLRDSGSRYEQRWEREVGIQTRRLMEGLHMDNASSSTSPSSWVRRKDRVAGGELCCGVSLFLMRFYLEWGALVGVGCLWVGRKQPTLELGYSRFGCPHLAHWATVLAQVAGPSPPSGCGQHKHHTCPVWHHPQLPASMNLIPAPCRSTTQTAIGWLPFPQTQFWVGDLEGTQSILRL